MVNNMDSMRTAYQEVCNSYHAIDNARIGLLGLLPLVSGTGIVVLLNTDWIDLDKIHYLLIGLFGFVVTLALFLYEIRGIQHCYFLIELGKEMESSLGVRGQFTKRPKPFIGSGKPSAARLNYPIVIAAWVFIGIFKITLVGAAVAALCVLVIGFFSSLVLTLYFECIYLEKGVYLMKDHEIHVEDFLRAIDERKVACFPQPLAMGGPILRRVADLMGFLRNRWDKASRRHTQG